MNSQNRFFLRLTGIAGAVLAGVLLGIPAVVAQMGDAEAQQDNVAQQQEETPTGQDPAQQQQQDQDGVVQQQDNQDDGQFAEGEDEGVRALW